MEEVAEWNFRADAALLNASSLSVRGVLSKIMAGIEDENGGAGHPRPRIPLGHGDPSLFPCFRSPHRSRRRRRSRLRASFVPVQLLRTLHRSRPGEEVADTAKKLGILVVADEVYGHLTYGSNSFVPMGVFGETVTVLTLGSISKRWVVPGWRLGWIVVNDPAGVLKQTKVVESLKNYLDISTDTTTFVQGAIPQIIENTKEDFFYETVNILRQTADICYEKPKEINCITCPYKPQGSMFVMVKLDLSQLENIQDDLDFCCKLAKEELVIILPGRAVGCKNWLRSTFAVGPSSLEDGLSRLKSFCLRHKKQGK